ncbi:UDP-3-O-(3-hydroxymyristoyl)glucosamine N-acyltransferase [subsurface metagenome]|jgi:sugar O-acyltransferase (sialic acid O-acetyltransferase NeuD family)
MIGKKEKLIIVGDSAFAQIAYEYFTHDSPYKVVAFSVEKDFLKKKELFGLPIIPFEELENLYDPSKYKVFIAIIYTQLNRLRTRLYKETKNKGFSLVSYVSSKAFVWRNVEIGENCFIFEDNTIQPFVKIGNNVILWSGNHIGHHSIIKDNCFFSSHVVVSGFCEVGKYCFLGVNATIANNIKIAENCFIGASAIILKDTEKDKIYGSKMTKSSNVNSFMYFGMKKNGEK